MYIQDSLVDILSTSITDCEAVNVSAPESPARQRRSRARAPLTRGCSTLSPSRLVDTSAASRARIGAGGACCAFRTSLSCGPQLADRLTPMATHRSMEVASTLMVEACAS